MNMKALVLPVLAIAASVCFAERASARDFGMWLKTGNVSEQAYSYDAAVSLAITRAEGNAILAKQKFVAAGYTKLHTQFTPVAVTDAGGVYTAKITWTITGRPPVGGGGPGGQ